MTDLTIPVPMISPITVSLSPPPQAPQGDLPWRPPQWGQPILTYLEDSKGVMYFFDAVIRAEHNSELKVTEHPIQSGANIVDHAYMLPNYLVLEIGMSDAMDVFAPGGYSLIPTKSISAYQALRKLQISRVSLIVYTRLYYYENMVIERIMAPDDFKTFYGLRCTVTLRQLITAQVGEAKISVRAQSTDKTNAGPVQPTPPDKSLLGQAEDYLLGAITGQ